MITPEREREEWEQRLSKAASARLTGCKSSASHKTAKGRLGSMDDELQSEIKHATVPSVALADLMNLLSSYKERGEELERKTAALIDADDALVAMRDAFVRNGVYDGQKGSVIRSSVAAIHKARAALQSKEPGA